MKKKQLNDTHKAGNLDIKMTNDLLFKYLLQKNSNVLKSIICSLLYMDESEVVDTVVTNPILLGEAITDKNVILDVNVLMNDNTHIDLEMQVIDYKDWPERSLIYGLRNLDDLEKGEDYIQIKPSIQLAFLDYQPFKGYDRFYSVNRLMDIEDHHLYTDNKLEKFQVWGRKRGHTAEAEMPHIWYFSFEPSHAPVIYMQF